MKRTGSKSQKTKHNGSFQKMPRNNTCNNVNMITTQHAAILNALMLLKLQKPQQTGVLSASDAKYIK